MIVNLTLYEPSALAHVSIDIRSIGALRAGIGVTGNYKAVVGSSPQNSSDALVLRASLWASSKISHIICAMSLSRASRFQSPTQNDIKTASIPIVFQMLEPKQKRTPSCSAFPRATIVDS